MQWSGNRRKWGLVRIAVMKYPNVLQAHSSLQVQSENLKIYAKIRLSEQGKTQSCQRQCADEENKLLNSR